MIQRDRMFYRFSAYGFLKNLRFFEPFILLFFRDAGLSFLEIGFLFSIRDLATNVLEIPTGVYADAFGRRRSMVMAFVSYILSFVIFYVFSSFALYAVGMILFAFGEAFRTGTHKALILEYLRLNDMQHLKVEYYGHTRGASQLGSALNSLVAAALVFYSGDYRYIFIASILPYVIDLINLATYPPELDGELVELRRGTVGEQLRGTLRTFFGVFRDAFAMRAILNSSGFDAFYKSTKEYLQPILQAFALSLPILVTADSTKRSAAIIGIIYFGIYLLTSYASRNSARFGSQFSSVARGINVTFLIGAVLLGMAGLSAQLQWNVVAILIFLGLYVLQNLRRPMNVAFISDQISSQVMAAGLSAESQFKTIFAAILSPILGALADWLGVGAALACLGAAMLMMGLLIRVRDQTRDA